MTDVLGWRKVFAIVGPSTNTIVQPDMEAMRPAGVTNQYRSIPVVNATALSDAAFMAGAASIGASLQETLRSAVSCAPDHLVLGISVTSFIGGHRGCDDFVRQVHEETGLSISVGSRATVAALQALGGVRRIAFLSPYYPAANALVRTFYEEAGFTVQRDHCLRCTSWLDIAQQPASRLVGVLRALDGDDVDAIVQVGTNLSMVALAAQAEAWLGKPVVAINTALYWHALRANGISEPQDGFGALLRRC
jgi:maleate isomerase